MMWGEIRARCQRLADKFCGQVFALEIYAGCCRWSGAVAAAGLNILVPIERSNGEWADTDNPWLRGCLLTLIELGLMNANCGQRHAAQVRHLCLWALSSLLYRSCALW